MSAFTYRKTESRLWTVGQFTPCGEWRPESDHGSPDDAAARAALLNGGREQGFTEYTVANGGEICDLKDHVERLLKVGWRLQGGVSVVAIGDGVSFCQAMVR